MFASICTAVIKRRAEKIGTPLASRLLSTVLPEHVLMLHRAHCCAERTPRYSARCLQIRRDSKALHRYCNAVALRVVEYWVP